MGLSPTGRLASLDHASLVAAFVAVRRPAPPGSAGRRCHCLAAPPLAMASPTRGPLPPCGVTPGRLCRAAGDRPAGRRGSRVSSDLWPAGHVARG